MMRFFRRATIIGFLALGVSLLMVPGPSSAAPKGQIVNALSSDISTLDPQNHNIRVNYIVGWHLYDNLVYRDQKTLKIGPHLAESWKIIDDNTWEFKLRKGIKFDNGEPFTAESVKFTIERGLDPKCPQRPSVSWVKEVKILDDYTVATADWFNFGAADKVPGLEFDFIQAMVRLGAKAEFGFCTVSPMWGYASPRKIAQSVTTLGAANCVLVSDAGQRHNPHPAEALRIFAQSLWELGVSEQELQTMMVDNPRQLLGLE